MLYVVACSFLTKLEPRNGEKIREILQKNHLPSFGPYHRRMAPCQG